jgi:membrane protein
VIVIFYYFCIAFLYRYGAATYRRFSFFSPGTTLATLLCILSSWAFSFYIDEFNRYDSYAKFYGSITTIIIVMLWIQINALVLLIGFELNASIAVNSDRLRAILNMRHKPADEQGEV